MDGKSFRERGDEGVDESVEEEEEAERISTEGKHRKQLLGVHVALLQ